MGCRLSRTPCYFFTFYLFLNAFPMQKEKAPTYPTRQIIIITIAAGVISNPPYSLVMGPFVTFLLKNLLSARPIIITIPHWQTTVPTFSTSNGLHQESGYQPIA